MRLVVALVVVLIPLSSLADFESAIRFENETFEEAARRTFRDSRLSTVASGTALSHAKPISRLSAEDYASLPEWTIPLHELDAQFEIARDERIYDENREFARRTSWFYPDDGCFARAAHMASSFERRSIPRPGKIYAFGALRFETDNNPRGVVHWWYHVAAAYRYRGNIVVMDPAVHHSRPILFDEWIRKISRKPESTKVALCDTYSYMPRFGSCHSGNPNNERLKDRDIKRYWRLEWSRVSQMGYDPNTDLRKDLTWGPKEIFELPFANQFFPSLCSSLRCGSYSTRAFATARARI